jgi:phosphoadenosine phosphosulfate reductase
MTPLTIDMALADPPKKPEQSLKVWKKERDLDALNRKYKAMTPEERIMEIYNDFDDILLSSSFGTTAVFQLHLFAKQGLNQPVHFIDTTYHFKQTLEYKDRLASIFNLDVIELKAPKTLNEETKIGELWQYDPDRCCQINKVDPFEAVKKDFELWISGLMSWQSNHREKLQIFEKRKGIIKFYPILDVKEAEVIDYIKTNDLPEHPLKIMGYESIGCEHCTIKGQKRKGRWAQTVKTECGLHL